LLARMLMENLAGEARVHVEDVQRVLARGGEAYGFSFTVADEVRGRVAVVRAGDYVALAVASWPMGAPPEVVDDVDAMIGSRGPGKPVASRNVRSASAKSATCPPAASTAAA